MHDLERAKALFLEGLSLHNHGRFEDAEQCYREAAVHAPDRPSILVNMAAVLISQLKFGEALEWSRRALAVEPGNPDAGESERYCLKMLAAQDEAHPASPDPEVLKERLALLVSQGRLEDGLAIADPLVQARPRDLEVRATRADLLAHLGRADDAIIEYGELLLGNDAEGRDGVGEDFCRNLFDAVLWPVNEKRLFDRLLARALETPWHRPAELAPLAMRRILQHDWASAALPLARKAWPKPALYPTSDPSMLDAAAGDALFLAALRSTVLADEVMEQVLVGVRFSLLIMACRNDAGTHAQALPAALLESVAIQCHLSEFVGPQSASESRLVEALVRRARSNTHARGDAARDRLLAIAMYGRLPDASAGREQVDAIASPELARVFTVQVEHALAERQLAQRMTSWSEIDDEVSRIVREQYEANPYPRWQATPVRVRTMDLAQYANQRLARVLVRSEDVPATPRILVAGGGTGQQPIELAARIRQAHVTSLDLSRASLAYAQRQADRLRVENVRFVHGDILHLDPARGPYQLIESSGVLHHMHSIEAGLESLLGVLAPTGMLRIGLYSTLGRTSVAAARALARQHGLEPSLEGLRRFRSLVYRLPSDHPARAVSRFSDFHSASECRDLAFHAHETTTDIAAIQALLDRFELEFLGLETTTAVRDAFLRSHPGAGASLELARWAEFEREHPEAFSGMYQFWARRRNP